MNYLLNTEYFCAPEDWDDDGTIEPELKSKRNLRGSSEIDESKNTRYKTGQTS